MKTKLMTVLAIALLVVLVSTLVYRDNNRSYQKPEPTNLDQCQLLTAEYMAYESCHNSMDCRLNDSEHRKYRLAKMKSVKYCGLAAMERKGSR